jgi:two-component system sensor histidine kinase KdpD
LKIIYTRKYKPGTQYIVSILLVLSVAIVCFLFAELIGYTVVALILLLVVSIIAMLFDILPVLTAAILSAIIWNFFFIPPLFTLHIYRAEDLLMFLLYFFIALVNAVLTSKIRKSERIAREKEEKEYTIKLYNTLLNSLSHELRTPIATILGAVDTLQESTGKLSKAQESALLFEIDKASLRLNRQVENLLNMSRLETGMLKLNLDWCDVNELIHAVIQKYTDRNGHMITFEVNETLPLFKLDRGLMEQVLQNLIHNAVNYTPEGTVIQIEASIVHDQCMIVVRDNGPGIPESELPLIFDKFYRLPNSKAGGSGLGLSIVKGFVEAHQGTIKVENETGGGAKFSIEIPTQISFVNNLKNE